MTAFLENTLMCIEKTKNLINYIMIMLAYLMLFIALFNAVCLHNAYFYVARDFCIVYANVFSIFMSTLFFVHERAMCSLEK